MNLSIYLITDSGRYKGKDFLWAIDEAVRGGVSAVQLREKNLDDAAFLIRAWEVREILYPQGVPLIINDRIEVAKKCGAQGVHLGQKDLSLSDARSFLGKKTWLGISLENFEQAKHIHVPLADYCGVGPVFSTQTKLDAAPVMSGQELELIIHSTALPCVAIGGINEKNFAQLGTKNLAGVAISSAIMHADSPFHSAQKLRELWEEKNEN